MVWNGDKDDVGARYDGDGTGGSSTHVNATCRVAAPCIGLGTFPCHSNGHEVG